VESKVGTVSLLIRSLRSSLRGARFSTSFHFMRSYRLDLSFSSFPAGLGSPTGRCGTSYLSHPSRLQLYSSDRAWWAGVSQFEGRPKMSSLLMFSIQLSHILLSLEVSSHCCRRSIRFRSRLSQGLSSSQSRIVGR
jgi:hypothetical protein